MADECYVTLTEFSEDKEILVAKTLARILGLNLREARNLLNSPANSLILNNIDRKDAEIIQQNLAKYGLNIKIDKSLTIETDKLALERYYFTLEKLVTDSQKKHQAQKSLTQVVNRQMPEFARGGIEKNADNLRVMKAELTITENKIEALRKYLKNAKLIQVLLTVIAGVITAIISHNPIATLVAVVVVFGVISAVDPESE